LLIEDDKIDAMTVKRSFTEIDVPNDIITVSNGEEALAYLEESANELPCLILLDLNMPRMNGIEFLKAAKTDMRLRKIPVIVLTTSNDIQDRQDCFELGAAGYMVKPVDYMDFVERVRVIDQYWSLSELPYEVGLNGK